jgi:hypothetical protein
MRKVVVAICMLAWLADPARADQRTRNVLANQTTQVAGYTAWDPRYCGSVRAVVTVLTKPQHGRLSNRPYPTTIGLSRFGASGQCYGTPTTGFAVYYTPVKGFRGADSFTLDISWPAIMKQATDTFVVNVQ